MTKLPDNLEKWIEEKWPFEAEVFGSEFFNQFNNELITIKRNAAREAMLYLLNDLGVMECLEFYTEDRIVVCKWASSLMGFADIAINHPAPKVLAKINGGKG